MSLLASCASVSKRMPRELNKMGEFLSQDDPSSCRRYHYNFERQTRRLYEDNQLDSILDIIDYIKSECGPAANLEITRLLLMIDEGDFGDTLVGSSTVPQMLWHRSEQERLLRWSQWDYLYGSSQPIDNTHENFTQFRIDIAEQVSSRPDALPSGRALGLFYSGAFDSAFSYIQSDELKGSTLQKNYDKFVMQTKNMFPTRGHIGLLSGSWRPRGANRLLGNHPEIGIQLGGEGKRWRADVVLSLRFGSARNKFIVDSLGQLVSTDEFNSSLLGVEGGFKFLDTRTVSSDIFVGLGYDAIYSVTKAGDPEESVIHGSLAVSVGLRQRVFLDQRSGFYVGAIVRYSAVDYGNPRGTDLSGNTLSISIVTGWSIHETLKQFLGKLNYKGSWRE